MPCFDEPSFKAVFQLKILLSEDLPYRAYSNTAVAEEYSLTGNLSQSGTYSKRVYVFEETPLMSTYLLAFVIGVFSEVKTTTKRGVEVATYTPMDTESKV